MRASIVLGFATASAILVACGGGSSSSTEKVSSGPSSAAATAAATSAAPAVTPCKLLTPEDLMPVLGGQVGSGNPLTPDICGMTTSGGAIASGGVLVNNQGAPDAPGDRIGDPTVAADGTAVVQVVKGKYQVKIQLGGGGSATPAQKTDWLKQLGQTVSSRLP